MAKHGSGIDGIFPLSYIFSMFWRLLDSFGDMVRFNAHLQSRFHNISGTRCSFFAARQLNGFAKFHVDVVKSLKQQNFVCLN